MTPSASYRTPVRPRNVGLWSYHLLPTSSSTFRSIAERRSPGISFLRASADAALLAPSMISVSTVRVTDAAAHAADRETCIGVTSLNTALTREGLNGGTSMTEAVSGPLRSGRAGCAGIGRNAPCCRSHQRPTLHHADPLSSPILRRSGTRSRARRAHPDGRADDQPPPARPRTVAPASPVRLHPVLPGPCHRGGAAGEAHAGRQVGGQPAGRRRRSTPVGGRRRGCSRTHSTAPAPRTRGGAVQRRHQGIRRDGVNAGCR